MSVKFIIAIIISLLNIFLGLIILRKNYKNPSNIYYCALCVSGGLWAIIFASYLIINSQILFDYFIRATYICVLVPLFYLIFVYHYPYRLWVYPEWLIRLIFIIPSLLVFFIFSGILRLEEVVNIDGLLKAKTIFPNFLFFVIYFFIYIIWGIVVLFKKFKRIEGVYKINIKYLITATGLTFLLTGLINVILPLLFGTFFLDWLGPIFTLINFVIIGYLIFIRPKVLR